MTRVVVCDCVKLVGFASILYGAWSWSPALAAVLGGALLVVVGAASKKKG